MNTVFKPASSVISFSPTLRIPVPRVCLQSQSTCCYHDCCSIDHCFPALSRGFHSISMQPLHRQLSIISSVTPSNEGTVSVIDFEDFMEKDLSFLEADNTNSGEELENQKKTDRIISAGEIGESSKVLVSIGSEEFVDRVVEASPCKGLLVVHDSLFVLACIKEKYDNVNCWRGELIYVPGKWAHFDAVFLYFLPALPFELGQVFGALAELCLPGARLVISHPRGRDVLQKQRQQYPEVVVSDLPDSTTLQDAAANHSFEMVEFVDEPAFYLAVLKFKGK